MAATLLAAVLVVIPATVARAAPLSLVVDNTTADAPDASPGDGLCQATSGGCTLRAAIQETNATPGKDGISFPPLDLDPAGSGIDVEITGVTIRGGSVATDGGGIRTKGHLTLTESVLAGNTAGDHGGGLLVDANAAVALAGHRQQADP